MPELEEGSVVTAPGVVVVIVSGATQGEDLHVFARDAQTVKKGIRGGPTRTPRVGNLNM